MGQRSGSFNPKLLAFVVMVALVLLVTFMPISPMEEVREYERLTTVKGTTVITGGQQVITRPTTVKKRYVVGWIQSITCSFIIYSYYYQTFLYQYGYSRRTIDVFDYIDDYKITPQSSTLSTIVLYKEGSIHDTIRNVYSYDLQYRDEILAITGETTFWLPDRTETFDVEKTVTRTTTTTRNVNVWVASGVPSSVGALISLIIIGAIVMLALFMKPSPPPTPPPPVVQAGPTYVAPAPPRVMGPTISGRGTICFGCGATISSGSTTCPRCGKPA